MGGFQSAISTLKSDFHTHTHTHFVENIGFEPMTPSLQS